MKRTTFLTSLIALASAPLLAFKKKEEFVPIEVTRTETIQESGRVLSQSTVKVGKWDKEFLSYLKSDKAKQIYQTPVQSTVYEYNGVDEEGNPKRKADLVQFLQITNRYQTDIDTDLIRKLAIVKMARVFEYLVEKDIIHGGVLSPLVSIQLPNGHEPHNMTHINSTLERELFILYPVCRLSKDELNKIIYEMPFAEMKLKRPQFCSEGEIKA